MKDKKVFMKSLVVSGASRLFNPLVEAIALSSSYPPLLVCAPWLIDPQSGVE
jgi:hypothetical protein